MAGDKRLDHFFQSSIFNFHFSIFNSRIPCLIPASFDVNLPAMKKLWDSIISRKEKPQPLSFQERLGNIERIIIVYPFKREHLRIAGYTLQRLFMARSEFKYLLLVPPQARLSELSVRHEYHLIDEDIRTDERDLAITKINAFKADILLQLEPEPNERLSSLVRRSDVPLKAGFGGENDGLNLIQAQEEFSFYEKNILNLIQLIVGK